MTVVLISNSANFGTAFSVEESGAHKFFTAEHVLTGMGIQLGANTAHVSMCDCSNAPSGYDLTNIIWHGCDVVEFRCDYPALPFKRGVPLPGQKVTIIGFPKTPSGQKPTCTDGVKIDGVLGSSGDDGHGCHRFLVSIHAHKIQHWNGMSGGPVLHEAMVVGLMSGASHGSDGSAVIITPLP